MHSSLVFASVFLVISQSWVSAMAISNLPRDFRVGTPGIVHYDGNVTKRDDVPDRFWVSTIRKGIYWYVPFYAGDENYVCMMGLQRYAGNWCPEEKWWPDDYVEDIITAGQDQITKDGGGKRSSKGVFEAKWEGYTTAIPDRGPMQATLDAYFRFSLPNCDAAPQACSHQNRHYYYNFKGESIGIVHKDGDCGGIGGDPLEYCPGQGHCKN
ncbi:hypothetical protein FALBO_5217 [Fusarium albosuccineum]|uniref:Uncharacterized protein n=1 Tax=Fusarium albosuccineum TaxID=1237068 RepID=A0A8H4PEG9_9HYPO|nr:hypothetical protein FALBO_5217 [Fusarium albosuccineum]